MALHIRRVVTTNDQNGKAQVLIDDVAGNLANPRPGVDTALIWNTDTAPPAVTGGEDAGARTIARAPVKNGTIFRIIEFGPNNESDSHVTETIDYALILKATSNVRDFDSSLPILLPFAAGCAVGLLGFARVLSYILEKFKAATLAVLTGFVIGSLGVIWPWKFTLEKMVGEKIVVTGYTWQLPAADKPFLLAVLLMLAGAGLVLLLDKIAGTKETKKGTKK